MRKLPILTLFFAAGLLAADKPLAPFVRKALTSAVYGEKAAATRYDAFAVKADQEGYPGAAALFRACAKAERIHLARFEAAMRSRGVEPSNETATAPSVGSTRDNLRAAASAEQTERDFTYKEACDTCTTARRRDGDVVRHHARRRDRAREPLQRRHAQHRRAEKPEDVLRLRPLRLHDRRSTSSLPALPRGTRA